MTVQNLTLPFGAEDLKIETGRLAKQAHGSIIATVGGTVALVAVTHSPDPLEGRDFFPLMVDYREKFYASGRIPGGFFRRESRPGDDETLKARITDRCLRPIFPDGMRHEVMIYTTIISSDNIHPAEIAALNAASLALQISDIPFDTPVAGARVARVDGTLILNPTYEQIDAADLSIIVAGTKDAINMVEGECAEVGEDVLIEALKMAHASIVRIIDESAAFVKAAGKAKFDPKIPTLPDDIKKRADDFARPKFVEMVRAGFDKTGYSRREHEIIRETLDLFRADHAEHIGKLAAYLDEVVHGEEVRKLICLEKKRVDGRAFDQIRPINCEVDVLPATHGSAIFTRGQTQALGVVTLGTMDEAQKVDNMLGISTRRFMLHYNFPPWSVGEARPMRATGRREIGHGFLAERALKAVLPDEADFPYTIRVVSEILESNGSSSMASACVGCLAMMAAGVPVKKPVAGIAMGLVEYKGDIAVLTDIQGVEDHLGDMDFKVTGTKDGVTAIQMDIKIESVSFEVLQKALHQARDARMHILGKMAEVLPAARPELSPTAPRLLILKIPVDKIGAIIGPGGKVIRGIIERCGVKIDVQDDGTVYVASAKGEAAEAARAEIENITAEVEIDRVYNGRVVRITDFGAFVELIPGKDGMVHISELDHHRVDSVEDVCSVGDEMQVKVVNIDDMGRVRLSRKALLPRPEGMPEEEPRGGGGGGGRDRDGGGRRDGGRGGRGGRDGGRGDGGRGRGGREGGRDRDGGREGGGRELGFRERKRSE